MELSVFQQGGIYLARLDPAKGAEIGKLRPVVVLTNQQLLDDEPLLIFVCPLSTKSQPIGGLRDFFENGKMGFVMQQKPWTLWPYRSTPCWISQYS